MSPVRVTDRYAYRGIDTVILENSVLRVVVLAGKGTDVIEFRDKRTDVDVLFDAPHDWQPLDGDYVPSVDSGTAWLDHYPGGWQDCLPLAGSETTVRGASYGLHAETSLRRWSYEITEDSDEIAAVTFFCDLVRYPFRVEKTLSLERSAATLTVTESIENNGLVKLPYVWLQHVAFGPPLVAPGARVDFPDATVTVESDPQGESPLTWGESFEWPTSDAGVDLSEVPPRDSGIHDLSYVHALDEGWYAITNPEIDLGVACSFDPSLFEGVWYWRSASGTNTSPFFGREYLVGLEPATGWPASDIFEGQGADGTDTLKTLDAGTAVETTFEVTTFRSRIGIESYDAVR